MRKSVQKAIANKRRESMPDDRSVPRGNTKKERKLRKQAVEQDFGNLPIR